MPNVESLQTALRVLVAERQELHQHGAVRDELEANRLQLVGRQQELSRALIDRYRSQGQVR